MGFKSLYSPVSSLLSVWVFPSVHLTEVCTYLGFFGWLLSPQLSVVKVQPWRGIGAASAVGLFWVELHRLLWMKLRCRWHCEGSRCSTVVSTAAGISVGQCARSFLYTPHGSVFPDSYVFCPFRRWWWCTLLILALESEGHQISEFEASLVYRVNSRAARATQRSPWIKKSTNKLDSSWEGWLKPVALHLEGRGGESGSLCHPWLMMNSRPPELYTHTLTLTAGLWCANEM